MSHESEPDHFDNVEEEAHSTDTDDVLSLLENDEFIDAPYPLYLQLDNQYVVVIGGGKVAERKIGALIKRGALVAVVAPEVTDNIKKLAQKGFVDWFERPYKNGDAASAFFVICAVGNKEVNELVYREALSKGVFLNVVDEPEKCNVTVPSVMTRGLLQIAVSTSGAAPSVSKHVRLALEEQFGSEWNAYVTLMGDVRDLLNSSSETTQPERAFVMNTLANADIIDRLKGVEALSAEDIFKEYVDPALGQYRMKDVHNLAG